MLGRRRQTTFLGANLALFFVPLQPFGLPTRCNKFPFMLAGSLYHFVWPYDFIFIFIFIFAARANFPAQPRHMSRVSGNESEDSFIALIPQFFLPSPEVEIIQEIVLPVSAPSLPGKNRTGFPGTRVPGYSGRNSNPVRILTRVGIRILSDSYPGRNSNPV